MNSTRFCTIGTVVLILTLAPCAFGQEYTFGQWAADTGLSPEATSVNASSQGITSLAGLSDFSVLTSVELWGNDISSIESDDFSGMTALRHLGLGLNPITSIEPSYWSHLGNLTSLDMAECPIATLPENGFLGLGSLEKLHLEWLPANTTIEAGAFAGLGNLTELNLEWTYTNNFAPGSFSGLSNLLDLRLGSMMTTDELASFDLTGLDSLTSLTLDSLSGVLKPGDLNNFNHLDQLRAYNGEITRVMPGSLAGFGGSLYLKLESLGALEPGSLAAPNLSGLFLNVNYDRQEWDMTDADLTNLASFYVGGSWWLPADLTLTDATLSQSAFDAIMGLVGSPGLRSLDLSFSDLSDVNVFLRGNPLEIYWDYGDAYLDLSNIKFSDSVVDSGYADVVAMINAASEAALNSQSFDYRDPRVYFRLTVDEALWDAIAPQLQLREYTTVMVVETVPEPMTLNLLLLGGGIMLKTKK